MNDGLCSYCELNDNGSVCTHRRNREYVLKSNEKIDGVLYALWEEDGEILYCGGCVVNPKIKKDYFEKFREKNPYTCKKFRLYEHYLNVTS